MPIPINILNQRFGRLAIVERIANSPSGKVRWRCCCDCGRQVIATGSDIRSGHTVSCGCWKREKTSLRSYIHGQKLTIEYNSWCAAKQRCYYPKSAKFKDYGARGITMCDEWRNDFTAFLRDMGPRPEGTTLERTDNDGSYCPANCKWATAKEQTRNMRRNRWITFKGETLCITDWEKRLGFYKDSIRQRLQNGWTTEKALTTPVARYSRRA